MQKRIRPTLFSTIQKIFVNNSKKEEKYKKIQKKRPFCLQTMNFIDFQISEMQKILLLICKSREIKYIVEQIESLPYEVKGNRIKLISTR